MKIKNHKGVQKQHFRLLISYIAKKKYAKILHFLENKEFLFLNYNRQNNHMEFLIKMG